MVQETQVYKVAEVQVSYKPDYNISKRLILAYLNKRIAFQNNNRIWAGLRFWRSSR